MTLLKAVLKALSDSSSSDRAMTEIGSLEFTSLSPAQSIRQRVRYSMGDAPTVSLNLKCIAAISKTWKACAVERACRMA